MKSLFLTLSLILLASCGASPIFNHNMEKNLFASSKQKLESNEHPFAKRPYAFYVDWSNGPVVGESSFIIKFWNQKTGTLSGPYVELPHELSIYLWMPAMGHGSSPVKLKQVGPGEYEVSNVYFIMAGKWELHVELLENKVAVDAVVLPLTL